MANMKLGLGYRHDYSDEDFYWSKVRDTIIAPVVWKRVDFDAPTDKVLLSRDCAEDLKFQQVFKSAVGGILPNISTVFQTDPLYSAAKGAAELAKQVLYVYNRTKRMS
jgi:hypothetical protein